MRFQQLRSGRVVQVWFRFAAISFGRHAYKLRVTVEDYKLQKLENDVREHSGAMYFDFSARVIVFFSVLVQLRFMQTRA